MLIALIGTAGRRDDINRLNRNVYLGMVERTREIIRGLGEELKDVDLVSGGAAWADHIAITLFLKGEVKSLTLHLPAVFENGKFLDPVNERNPGTKMLVGSVANYYHHKFCEKMGGVERDYSLRQIGQAIHMGANVQTYKGFHARNVVVGKADVISAMTFGTRSGEFTAMDSGWHNNELAGLKDGGTAHTWNGSPAPHKIHTNLFELT